MPTHAEHSLPEALYSADSVRAMDRYLIDQQGVDGFDLMQAAARAAFRQLLRHWPAPGHLLVLCGAGNNGGDGYLIAARARRRGIVVDCIAVTPGSKLSGDALKAMHQARAEGVVIQGMDTGDEKALAEAVERATLVVDAMLGTGVSGAPREPFATVIRQVNASGLPVLAVDLPSGLDASTGAAAGDVVLATVTVTFIGAKLGLYTGAGAGACGQVVFEPLDTGHDPAGSGEQPVARLGHWPACQQWLKPRPANAHKGQFGHIVIVAGDHGFGGAGIMAAEAALRSGAGLVTLATRPEHVTAALARCPSLMVRGINHGAELSPLLASADVVVCGPGLGRAAWGQQMLQQVVESGKLRVLDADALNLMAGNPPVKTDAHVLTPHPGEAARLLGSTVVEVEADRVAAVRRLHQDFGGVVLLKGAGTLVMDGGLPVVVAGANPGLATGGMGDVLAGIIGALIPQIDGAGRATIAAAAAHLHGADLAVAERSVMGVIPEDVIQCLPRVFRGIGRVQRASEQGDI